MGRVKMVKSDKRSNTNRKAKEREGGALPFPSLRAICRVGVLNNNNVGMGQNNISPTPG